MAKSLGATGVPYREARQGHAGLWTPGLTHSVGFTATVQTSKPPSSPVSSGVRSRMGQQRRLSSSALKEACSQPSALRPPEGGSDRAQGHGQPCTSGPHTVPRRHSLPPAHTAPPRPPPRNIACCSPVTGDRRKNGKVSHRPPPPRTKERKEIHASRAIFGG